MNRLKELRSKSGLYQKDVASLLGVDRTTYVKYENGDIEPGIETLKKLASYFGVTVDYLLGSGEPANQSIDSGSDISDKSKVFMKRLKELRKSKGYSQKELADFLYVNQTAVSQWERGVTTPGADTIAKLCRMFGVTSDYLLDLEPSNQEPIKQQNGAQSGPTVVVMSGGNGPVIHKTNEKKEREEILDALLKSIDTLSNQQIKALLGITQSMNTDK